MGIDQPLALVVLASRRSWLSWALRSSESVVAAVVESSREEEKANKRRVGGGGEGLGRRRR